MTNEHSGNDRDAAATESLRFAAELKARDAELAEALEQQAATAEILKIISSSPTDTQPVFEAIVRSGARLFRGKIVSLRLVSGDRTDLAASTDPAPRWAIPLSEEGSVTARVILRREVIQVSDIFAEPWIGETTKQRAGDRGFRAIMSAPMLKEGVPIGVISVMREAPGLFAEHEVALLQTFASQAVIAIENVRLFNETKEALEQQTATAEILRVISSSPTNIQPVLDAVAVTAARLCAATDVVIRLVDGNNLAAAAHIGSVPVETAWTVRPLSSRALVGRAVIERRTIQVADFNDPEVREQYPDSRFARRDGLQVRTVLAVPLVRDDSALGAIVMRRQEARPFSDKQIKLLQIFAAQAVIAIENIRLFNETKEALEQQTATAEILRVISSSPTDTQPVFDAIVKSGVQLFGGLNMSLRLVKGDFNETVASSLSSWDERGSFSTPLDDDRFVSPRAMMRRDIVHVPDIRDEAWLHERMRKRFEEQGSRAVLCAPMIREDRAIGAITVIRAAPGAFNDKQIALLKTFAAQAVIAIENVRLFNETKDALDQQRASGEVLRVISSSVEDTKPVFEAILQGCGRLFEGRHVGINLVEDGQIYLKAYQGPARGNFEEIFPLPLSAESGAGMAILGRRIAHYPDVEAGTDVPHYVRRGCEIIGIKSVIFAPMLQDGGGIGAIFVGRDFPGTFSEKEISLLQTFADQAVIAIQNVRLFNETREALEQQTATADILRVISSSPTDTQPVFEAVAENSARLCEASDAVIHLREGDELRYVAHHGRISTMPIGAKRPIRADWVAGRAALVARQIHVFDAQAEHDEYPDGVMLARLNNYRTILVTPMLHEGAVVGTIAIRRTDARSFTEKQMALVRTFANQGAIAIENVRLFKELQGRNAAITEALEQQTATAEILKVISSSPTDIQPVLDAVAGSAARLCGTDDVYIRRIDGETTRRVAHVGTTPMEAEGEVRPLRLRTIAGAVARECKTIHIPDVTEPHVGERYPESLNLAGRSGFRTFLYVPLVREGTAIGMIVMRRRKVRPFTDKQIELLETFAAQAVIAIENVRLFNETKEALEQQTVTAEILKVISSSPTDVQPVFDAIVRSGRQLFRGLNVSLRVVKGDHAVRVASTSLIDDPSRDANPIKDEGLPGVRAMSCREAVQIPDILAEQWVSVRVKQTAELRGWRAILSAPMLRENDAIGLISVTRVAPGPFSEKEVALLKTFAAQAVIAIENVRLFKELEARNAEVSEALKRQTATAEILEVISSSPTNVEPVFQAVAERAARICDATNARVFLVEGGNLRCAAEIGGMPGLAIGDLVPLDRGWPTGRAVIDRRIMHIEDVTALPVDEYPIARRLQSQFGHRTILVVPLMRENVALGAILLRRMEVRPFDDKQVALLQTFAAQAVIAIENARLFNEIRQKSRELESANKHKSEFLANMSHELRTPLNAIIGFSEALVEKMFGELNPKQEDYLRDIHSSGRHLLSLINDILDLSKIEAGRMELDLSEFSVPMALKNAMSLVRGRAQTHGIALKLRLDPKLSEIRADERKFKQIVVNLLSNAVKFTPDGGSVQLNARLNRELLKISVKDDGIGIAQADQAALFEAFRQVGKSSSGQREGTGLGLALSRRFVELHGGKIELDSKPGKGSTFTFTLPVQPGARRATRGKGLS